MRLIAIYRTLIRFSALPKGSPHGDRDNGFKACFWRPFFLLIISGLAISFSPRDCKAQKTNELAFEQLVSNFLASDPRKFSSVLGYRTPGLLTVLDSVPGADRKLRIDPPLVTYENLKGALFAREIQTDVVFIDSTEHLSTLTWRDTLHRRDLGKVRKTSPPELKGNDPRWTSKILAPALLVGAGISGIISLFYIRSA